MVGFSYIHRGCNDMLHSTLSLFHPFLPSMRCTRRPSMAPLVVLPLCLLILSPWISANGASAASLPSTGDYENVALLDGGFELFWSVNSSAETIHMAARAKTKGWLAVGFSEIGGMSGSDAMVGWVSDSVVYATDRFIFNKSMDASGVALDAQQDWRLLGGHEEVNQSSGDTWTTIHFWRELDTGDCNDRPIPAPGMETYIIWAMGDSDELSYHGATRGGMTLTLIPAPGPTLVTGPPSPSPSSSQLSTTSVSAAAAPAGAGDQSSGEEIVRLNLTHVDYLVPPKDTTYMCRVYDLPLANKSHIVEWGLAFNGSDLSLLHHAVIYGCYKWDYPKIPTEQPWECPQFNHPCSLTAIAVWIAGGTPFKFPSNVGMPLGLGYFTKVVLQMHYNNPSGRSDAIDSSGIYFNMATKPRTHDAAIMVTGPANYKQQIMIPPNMPSWTMSTFCPSICLSPIFKNRTVNIIASTAHMHATGRQAYTELYRDGKLHRTVARQDYFDASNQRTIAVVPPVAVLPTDELKTTCVWDSRGRSKVTKGGESAVDEMCHDYILYYPAKRGQVMSSCTNICLGKFDSSLKGSDDLRRAYICGEGTLKSLLRTSNDSCDSQFGASRPADIQHGCTNSLKASLSDIRSEAISLPALPTVTLDSSDSSSTADKASTSNLESGLLLVLVITAVSTIASFAAT